MKNIKHQLAVKRRDAAIRNTHVDGALVTPSLAPTHSWWTTARREGFTQQAREVPRVILDPRQQRGSR